MLILSNNDQNGAHELLRIWGVPKIEILGQIRKVGLRDDTNYLYPAFVEKISLNIFDQEVWRRN